MYPRLKDLACDLTENERHVIALRFLERRSQPETAAILGKT